MDVQDERKKLATWIMQSGEDVLEQIKAFREQLEKQSSLSEEQWDEIDKRREAHLKGESKSYTWEEVKKRLLERHDL